MNHTQFSHTVGLFQESKGVQFLTSIFTTLQNLLRSHLSYPVTYFTYFSHFSHTSLSFANITKKTSSMQNWGVWKITSHHRKMRAILWGGAITYHLFTILLPYNIIVNVNCQFDAWSPSKKLPNVIPSKWMAHVFLTFSLEPFISYFHSLSTYS